VPDEYLDEKIMLREIYLQQFFDIIFRLEKRNGKRKLIFIMDPNGMLFLIRKTELQKIFQKNKRKIFFAQDVLEKN